MLDMEPRPRFLSELRELLARRDYARRQVSLLLGSDEYIRHETRVAFIPRHLELLRSELEAAGLEPEVLVLEGAGTRAGFADADYAAAGARVVGLSEVSRLGRVDVLHALKEPTAYESDVPGPFLRIGALHLASYPPGVCRMLEKKSFTAIFDGGTVGGCSYLVDSGDRTPIVAAMSRFAGTVSGIKLVEGLEQNGLPAGKVVVVGGGVAGQAAIDKVRPKLGKLVVIERYPPTREKLEGLLTEHGIRDFEILPELTDDALDDAVGVVFAHRSGARAAEKVCTYDQIRRMRRGAAVVDIAIDQGGSINHADYDESDDATTSRRKYKELFAGRYYYYAETNMPREVPREASLMHGDSSWAYVVMLLALCAVHGDAAAVAAELLRRDVEVLDDPASLGGRSLWDCLAQDLRNGLQLAVDGAAHALITDPEVEKNAALARWVRNCAGQEGL